MQEEIQALEEKVKTEIKRRITISMTKQHLDEEVKDDD